jgi:hypothetical protein
LDIYYDLSGIPIEERTGVSASSAGNVYRQYVLSPTDGSIIFSEKPPATAGSQPSRIYAIKDEKGSVRALVGATYDPETDTRGGALLETFNYSPYGVMTSSSAGIGHADNDWRYFWHGMRYDFGARLYQQGGRAYDALLGNWQSPALDQLSGGKNPYKPDNYATNLAGSWNVADRARAIAYAATHPSEMRAHVGDVEQPEWIKNTATVSRIVGVAAITAATGGMAGAYLLAGGASMLTVGAVAGAVGGLAGGVANSISEQLGTTGTLDLHEVAKAGAIGAATGFAAGAAGAWAGQVARGFADGMGLVCVARGGTTLSGIAGGFVRGTAERAAAGFVDGAMRSMIDGGSAQDAMLAGLQGSAIGAGIGGIAGAIFHKVCFVAGTQVVVGLKVLDEEEEVVTVTAQELLEQELQRAAEAGGTGTAVATQLRIVDYVTVPAETVQKGDLIVSRDENDPDGPLVARRVTQTYRRLSNHLQILEIQDKQGIEQTIQTTDEHPFRPVDEAWAASQELEVGKELTGASEPSLLIGNRREEYPEYVTVYNMQVEGTHTYFVRAEGSTGDVVWVHNASAQYELEQTLREENGVTGQSQAEREFYTSSGRRRIADAVFDGASGEAAGEAKYIRSWEKSIFKPNSPVGAETFAGKVRQGIIDQAKDYLSTFKTVEYYSNSREFISHYSQEFANAGIDMRRVTFKFRP